jgi:anti-anti-sigma regulatory factor
MKPHFVEFYTSSPNGLRAQAKAAVSDAMRRGSTILVVGLDSLPRLDDSAIAATIVAMRGLRATGGTVRLVTQNVTHRRLLEALGLDRIFGVFASFEEAGERGEQRDRSFFSRLLLSQIARVALGTLLFVTPLLQAVSAQEDASAAIDDHNWRILS